ncbi:hypothetical protein L218DRAFT_943681 [Marasmius fiardii PR-910]|nr:hypothetical protein L218DRAFT_943681 [Marasmius fiardii PR-910]
MAKKEPPGKDDFCAVQIGGRGQLVFEDHRRASLLCALKSKIEAGITKKNVVVEKQAVVAMVPRYTVTIENLTTDSGSPALYLGIWRSGHSLGSLKIAVLFPGQSIRLQKAALLGISEMVDTYEDVVRGLAQDPQMYLEEDDYGTEDYSSTA